MTDFGKAVAKGEGQPIKEWGEPVERWQRLDAYQDLMEFLGPDETVLGIVFGEWGWGGYGEERDRKSTRLNSSHTDISRMPSSA